MSEVRKRVRRVVAEEKENTNVYTVSYVANFPGKKPNKTDAHKELMYIIDTLDDKSKEKVITSLSSLYKYFLPSVPAKPKTPEQWLAKALANKNETRKFLQYMHKSTHGLCATDGHRLHIWTDACGTYVDGFYDQAGTLIVSDLQYPDVACFIESQFSPGWVEATKDSFLLSAEKRYRESIKGDSYALQITGEDSHTIAGDTQEFIVLYVNDVLSGLADSFRMKVTMEGKLFFASPGRYAIVMGLRK